LEIAPSFITRYHREGGYEPSAISAVFTDDPYIKYLEGPKKPFKQIPNQPTSHSNDSTTPFKLKSSSMLALLPLQGTRIHPIDFEFINRENPKGDFFKRGKTLKKSSSHSAPKINRDERSLLQAPDMFVTPEDEMKKRLKWITSPSPIQPTLLRKLPFLKYNEGRFRPRNR